MSGLRFVPIFVVLVLCYQDAIGFELNADDRDNPSTILKNVLDKAVEDNVIDQNEADTLSDFCARTGLNRQSPGEILKEALEISWRSDAVSSESTEKLKMWASKIYPEYFEALKYVSASEAVSMLSSDLPDIENQLGQLNGKKLKVVEVAATILNEAMMNGKCSKKNAAKVVNAIFTHAQQDKDAMTILNDAISDSVSQNLIPEQLVWFFKRFALNEDLDKEDP